MPGSLGAVTGIGNQGLPSRLGLLLSSTLRFWVSYSASTAPVAWSFTVTWV
jgi:hypothetical protein